MKLLFTLLSFCMLFACTITKRHFGSGYHIEWKRNLDEKKNDENPQEKLPLEVSELRASSEEIEATKSDVVTPEVSLKEIKEDTVSLTDGRKVNKTVGMQCVTPQQQVDNLSLQDQGEPAPEVKKKTEPLTWVSLALLFGIGISIILISVFSSFLYLGTGIFLSGLILVMFICSLISFIRIHRHPDRYKNKEMTNILFFFFSTCLIIAVLYLLLTVAVSSW
ncbi:hypothetical protein D3C87_04320 [compost metagenome]